MLNQSTNIGYDGMNSERDCQSVYASIVFANVADFCFLPRQLLLTIKKDFYVCDYNLL